MMKTLRTVTFALLATLQISPWAVAQQSPVLEAQMQMLRDALSNQNRLPTVSPAAAADRIATIRFNIVIHKNDAFDVPLRCTAQITHQPPSGTGFGESASVRASFSGSTGHCVVPIRFHWSTADDATSVRMVFAVGFDTRVTDIGAAEAGKAVRSMQFNPADIPLPVQNSVVTLNFSVDM